MTRRRMRFRSVASEAWRDLVTGTARAGLCAVILTVTVGALTFADTTAVQEILRAAERFQSSGASVATLTAPGLIDGASCDALAQVPGVRASGALRATRTNLVAAALPDASLPTMEISTGLVDLLDLKGDPTSDGVLLSHDAADTLALRPGDTLTTTHGRTPVTAVYAYPDDGRRSGLGYAALIPLAAGGRFDECWVDAWPSPPDLAVLLRTALAAAPSPPEAKPPQLSQLNTTLGRRFDGQAQFEARVTRHAPVAAIIVGFTLGFASVRARRLELASAQHGGVGLTAQAGTLLIESTAWVLASVLLASPLVVALATGGEPADTASLAWIAARTPLAAVPAVLAGVVTATCLTRERHLFAYFKNR